MMCITGLMPPLDSDVGPTARDALSYLVCVSRAYYSMHIPCYRAGSKKLALVSGLEKRALAYISCQKQSMMRCYS